MPRLSRNRVQQREQFVTEYVKNNPYATLANIQAALKSGACGPEAMGSKRLAEVRKAAPGPAPVQLAVTAGAGAPQA